ncbi:lectin vip36 [Fasciola hepatica]|uniref:Lectin vip36 n=1 Tax=Fasciola hepatica TaxID=6192 RepID=A0A4E0RYU2_FASHE|nr:lectin vip36 [Fasciola hepatica]
MSFTLFLVLTSVYLTGAYGQFEKRQYSLNSYQRSNWNFYGDAIVQPEFVRLTNDLRSQKGGVSCVTPSTSLNWEIHITFHVHGEGKHLYGDGFAFWYTRDPITFGSAFGAQPNFNGLGVFFDTYANQNGAHSHEHPYISVMVSNGSVAYDHDRDGTLTAADGCSSNFRNKPYSTAIISYVNHKLSVVLKYPNQKDDVNCIAVDNVRLPVGYYLGLSAATGDLTDAHDIYSVRFFEVESDNQSAQDLLAAAQIEPSIDRDIPTRDRVPDEPVQSRTSRIFWGLIFWLFILACIGGCGFAGYTYYNRRQRRMKRLY